MSEAPSTTRIGETGTATRALPPGPKARIPSLRIAAFRENLLNNLQKRREEYGEVAMLKTEFLDVVLVTNPELAKKILVNDHEYLEKSLGMKRMKFILGEGLLTSEGTFHHRQRQLVAPAFHREALRNYANDMIHYAARTRGTWADGTTMDMTQKTMRLTLAIVAKTRFSANVDDAADTVGQSLHDILEGYAIMYMPFGSLYAHLVPTRTNRRLLRGRKQHDDIIYGIINQRRKSGETGTDLLGMLLASREEGGGEEMSAQQARDEALTLFLARHETTAVGLTWTWKLPSENLHVREQLEAELDEALRGHTPTNEDLPKLSFTHKVFQESMRIYPPAYAAGRRALRDYEVDGYTVPAKRTMILVSPHPHHHDPRWFPDPEKFDPSRWTPEFEAGLHKFAYFPFGGAPRVCIGANFAWMEAVLRIATLAQHWRIHMVPGQDIRLSPKVTLRPKPGIQMPLERRKARPMAPVSAMHRGVAYN